MDYEKMFERINANIDKMGIILESIHSKIESRDGAYSKAFKEMNDDIEKLKQF